MKVHLKSWDELVNEFGSFINEDNFSLPEIYLRNDNVYITREYSLILNTSVEVENTFKFPFKYFTRVDNGHWICRDMIKA